MPTAEPICECDWDDDYGCPLCTGEDCGQCWGEDILTCDHDVMDRHINTKGEYECYHRCPPPVDLSSHDIPTFEERS